MTKKDYKVLCSILVGIADDFSLSKVDEKAMVDIASSHLSETYDKFDHEQFVRFYAIESADLDVAKEEAVESIETPKQEEPKQELKEPVQMSFKKETEADTLSGSMH